MTSSSLLEGIFFSLFIAGAILAVLVFKPGNQQAVRGSPLPPTSVQQKEAPPFPSRSTSETTPTHIGKDETTSDDGQSKPTTATGAEQNPLIEAHSDGSRAQPTCFRISGIPSDWDRNKLEQALRDIDPDLDLKERDELYELCPACCESTQTALLNLERCTAYFQNFQQNEERSKVITENGRKIRLVFDKHFYDLTPMNGPATPIVADVIAITGLGGHAYGSWRSRTMTERSVDRPMWLRDFLPVEIVGIRIMTYGYDSSLRNPNGSNLTDYRRNFIECLQNSRGNCPKRPIIFIGHSLGGILVVQTLVELRKYSKYHAIFDCVRGIFFFGTPHQGLRTVELEEMAGELDDADSRLKVQNLLRQLQDGSEFLENQKDDLSELWGKFHGKVFTFYETDKTQSVKKLGPGVFARAGEAHQMVNRLSAQLYLPGESRSPIASTHTDMVKFDAPHNRAFQSVVRGIKECVAVDHPKRDRILQLLSGSMNTVDHYLVDQNEYLERFQNAHELKNDDRYFWIFRNLDYQTWFDIKEAVQVLVVYGSPTVEHAASHVVNILRRCEPDHLVLHFFYGSTRNAKRLPKRSNSSDWENLVCVCTLLRQAIDAHPPPQQQTLFEVFITEILAPMDDKMLEQVPTVSTDAFAMLLGLSTIQDLLLALRRVLSKAAQSNGDKNTAPNKRNLTFIVDLDNRPMKTNSALIDNLRREMEGLRRDYRTVRLLITNPPTRDHGLKQPSEAIIQYDKERKDCLNTLRFRNSRFEKISSHDEHTFEWFEKCREYRDWNDSERSSLFLVEGKPGSGKSTLTRYFTNLPKDGAIVAKFFYSHRDGELERNHRIMVQCLLYDILNTEESFFIHFQQAYRDLGGPPEPHCPPRTWTYETLKKILRACAKHPVKRKLLLIVDAMDESDDEDRADIVQFLWDLSVPTDSGCVVKVFLACRPINDTPAVTHGSYRIRLQEKNKEDIVRYTCAFLRKPVFGSIQGFSSQIEEYIIKHADGAFLWVRLLEDELVRFLKKGAPPARALEFLRSLPLELERYYERILQNLDGGDPDDIRYGQRIFQFCFFSHRAIEIMELAHALAISGEIGDPPPDTSTWEMQIPADIERLVNNCARCLVEIRNTQASHRDATDHEGLAIVQVMHQTVRQFFFRPHGAVGRSPNYRDVADEQRARAMIETTCVNYLKLHHAELVRDFHSPAEAWSDEDFGKFVRYLNERPFIKYSLEYLSHHDTPKLLPGGLRDCPQSPAFCVIKKVFNSSAASEIDQRQRNQLLGIAAAGGFALAVTNLLAADANCDSLDENYLTPLQKAASNGHEAAVRLLLDRGADIEAKRGGRGTALHTAACNGHEATVWLLLNRGADIEAKNNDGLTALHNAASNGREATVRLLLDCGANIKAEHGVGLTALHNAASNGKEATVRLLLDRGADIEAENNLGWTALHTAAWNGHEATVRLLLDRGADIEAENNLGWTALFTAAWNGHEAIVRLLLDRGADIEAKNNYGRTALHTTVSNGHKATVRLLLDRGADIEAKDTNGFTALHKAALNGDEATVRLLLDRGADIEAKDGDGSTALYTAAFNGDEATVRLLLDCGADPEAKNDVGWAVLHTAAWNGHKATVRLLLDRGADIEAKNNDGFTALHKAAWTGHEATARLLLDRGADIEAKDYRSWTALHAAAWNGHEATVRLLRARGATEAP